LQEVLRYKATELTMQLAFLGQVHDQRL